MTHYSMLKSNPAFHMLYGHETVGIDSLLSAGPVCALYQCTGSCEQRCYSRYLFYCIQDQ